MKLLFKKKTGLRTMTSQTTTCTNLSQANPNIEYIIKDIQTGDEELTKFLFTLGCYKGEQVTVLSVLEENFVISVKDARYGINQELAEAILI